MSLFSSLKPIDSEVIVDAKFGSCINCNSEEAHDCPLYLCIDENGLMVICCIVYVVNNHLTIVRRMDGLINED